MITIRNLEPGDWPAVREIYLQGIATGQATLETSAPEWQAWDQAHVAENRFVALLENDEIAGWAA